jgi:hypothetical protein
MGAALPTAIGRLPAATAADAEAMVDKLVAYDEAADPRLGLFNEGLTEGSDTPAAAEPTEAVAPEDGASRKSGGCAVQPSHGDMSIVLLGLVVLGLLGRRRSRHLAIFPR